MTSVTERLRALLDERGVEWRPIAWNPKKETFYYTSDGVGFCADEYVDGVKIYTDALLTPEQAVAATLGPGTCRDVRSEEYTHHHNAPTVEDVLREYALKCEEAGNSGPEVKRLAAEYAARLMLAGEE